MKTLRRITDFLGLTKRVELDILPKTGKWTHSENLVAAYISICVTQSKDRVKFERAYAEITGRTYQAVRRKVQRMSESASNMTHIDRLAWQEVYRSDYRENLIRNTFERIEDRQIMEGFLYY